MLRATHRVLALETGLFVHDGSAQPGLLSPGASPASTLVANECLHALRCWHQGEGNPLLMMQAWSLSMVMVIHAVKQPAIFLVSLTYFKSSIGAEDEFVSLVKCTRTDKH